MKVRALLVFFLFLHCGPMTVSRGVESNVLKVSIRAPRTALFRSGVFALHNSGYPIAFSDKNVGRVVSRPKRIRLATRDCDCGGIQNPLEKSDSGSYDVSFIIIVNDGSFTVQTFIEQHVPTESGGTQTVRCISRGKLENEIAEKMKQTIKELNHSSHDASS